MDSTGSDYRPKLWAQVVVGAGLVLGVVQATLTDDLWWVLWGWLASMAAVLAYACTKAIVKLGGRR